MSSVTRYPTSNAVGVTGFTNPGNAYASDDSYATAAPGTLSTISSYFGGFDFASYIPSGATISAVIVHCERKFSTTASNASSTLRPYNSTTALAAENENVSEPTTDTEYTVDFGALTTADVRSTNFRILVGAKRGSGATGYTYSLDVVYVEVTYTVAYTLTCDYASFTLGGQDANLNRGRYLLCSAANYYVIGQTVTLTYTPASSTYTLTCDYAGITHTGQDISFLRALMIVGAYGSFQCQEQTANLLRALKLTCDYSSFTLAGQIAGLLRSLQLASEYAGIILTGQDITLTYTAPGAYNLETDYASFTLTGVDLAFNLGVTLSCVYGSYNLYVQSVQLFYELWEPSGDMITLGTLLTRIQHALGDTSGLIWDRTTVIWPFTTDAIRAFPILRPKSNAYTVGEGEEHSFSLPADFRKVIYVEYPPYQDPPEYLSRKSHLHTDFFGEDGFYDVDRDYDAGEDYMLWVSDTLAVDDIVIIRYLATHTTEFANEYSYITIENQYVQVIINHVILMCYQERLAKQLQDPTAHTSTVNQMSEAVRQAEVNYLDLLHRAEQDVSNSQRVEGWKVDKHDRIY